jgi:hypothetical protein
MEPTNDERADWAFVACQEFAEATGLSADDELPTVITDLIANLLHLADREGMCVESCLDTARMHYEAEQEEDE